MRSYIFHGNSRATANAPLVQMIIETLKGLSDENTYRTSNYGYLLNQCIRQYLIEESHWHISKAALFVFDHIADSNVNKNTIDYFGYQELIQCKNELPISMITTSYCDISVVVQSKKLILTYKDNNKNQQDDISIGLSNTNKVAFNQIFTADHVIPIKYFIDALQNTYSVNNNITHKQVVEILDQMHIARILKQEDKKLPRFKRGENINGFPALFKDIEKKIYNNDNGIILI